jgi:fucose 4-O-acetylase-like acetyltransferase
VNSQQRAARFDRVAWVDVARGIAIVLVVYGHALRGIYWPTMPPRVAAQDTILYAFHMPVFFVLAGLFLWPSLAKGRKRCFTDKLTTVVYPYFLWSLIAGGVELAASPLVNSPISAIDLIKIPVAPIEQFWFLYALFLIQVAIIAIYPRKPLVYVLALLAFALVAAVDVPRFLVQSTIYFPYVAAGVAAAASLKNLSVSSVTVKLLALVGSWSAFAVVMIGQMGFGLEGLLSKYLAGFTGTAGTIAGSMLLADLSASRSLVALGRASMAIYVMHTIVSAGTRVGAKLIGPSISPEVIVILSTTAGVLIPYAVHLLVRGRGLAHLLGLGGRLAGQGSGLEARNP